MDWLVHGFADGLGAGGAWRTFFVACAMERLASLDGTASALLAMAAEKISFTESIRSLGHSFVLLMLRA